MTSPIFSLEQLDAVYKIEQDWLFEKLLEKLNAHMHLILSAEKHPDIHICYIDIKPAHSTISFLELFVAALSHRFPEVTSHMKIDNSSMDTLTLPALSSIPGQFPPVSPI